MKKLKIKQKINQEANKSTFEILRKFYKEFNFSSPSLNTKIYDGTSAINNFLLDLKYFRIKNTFYSFLDFNNKIRSNISIWFYILSRYN